MANHCINKVRVLGVKGEALEKIMSVFKDGGFGNTRTRCILSMILKSDTPLIA